MANHDEWSEQRDRRQGYGERYGSREEEARRSAERHAEQERSWGRDPERRRDVLDGGDFGSGWYGEEAERRGYDAPGPYGQAAERREGGDPARFDRYSGSGRDSLPLEAEAARLGRDVERGWRRFSHDVRHAFEQERGPGERDPRRGGGMFGGRDRPDSLFSHDDGLGGRRVGSHRGKGPKGYVRPDERILEEISDRLSDDAGLDASEIEIKVDCGEVTLNGHVSSREDKRRAEDLAERVSGVKHLQNNLRVRPQEQAAGRAYDSRATGGQNASAAAAAGTMGSTGGTKPNPRPD